MAPAQSPAAQTAMQPPAPPPPALPPQTLAQPPTLAPAAQPEAPAASAAMLPPPEPASAPQPDPDEAAWQNAIATGTRASFADYLKEFFAGVHAQEAQLRIANLILNAAATAKSFDGTWQTEWTCPNLGQYPGYTYRFIGQIKDGAYHGVKGVKGDPSSLDLNGKIDADGAAAFFGELIVGSSLAGLGAARGTPSDFHALAHFDRAIGDGKRIEGRPCTLSFAKQ
jgi:hypothetical protein